MRELKRSIARHLMQLHGVMRINKPQFTETRKDGIAVKRSYFARHWREYLDPESKINKRVRRFARKAGKTQVMSRG